MTVAAGWFIAITFPISPRISRWSYQDYSCLSAGSSAGLAAVAGSHAGYSDTLLWSLHTQDGKWGGSGGPGDKTHQPAQEAHIHVSKQLFLEKKKSGRGSGYVYLASFLSFMDFGFCDFVPS